MITKTTTTIFSATDCAFVSDEDVDSLANLDILWWPRKFRLEVKNQKISKGYALNTNNVRQDEIKEEKYLSPGELVKKKKHKSIKF